ncbi:MAG: FtsX-like permease family protein, partial [Gemmatimonadaceae bacterium]|nr:FtsX-like permease family protein [Gemmatimonadaceae bacterium]
AVRLALATIREQKLRSSFTLLGVTIGVMFLIAVVSIVEGMSKYMEEDFAGRLLGVNTFTVKRFPWFNNNVTEEMWREWQRRPRVYYSDLDMVTSVLPTGTRYAVESQDNVRAQSPFARVRQVEAHAVDGDYFTIKHYDLTSGRTFTQQELQMGTASMVIGSEVASYFFPNLDPLGRELRIGGIPYTIVGVIAKQGTLFGLSLDKIVIAPYKSPLHRLTNPKGDIDGIIVQSPTALAMDDAMEQVREVMRGHRKLHPGQPDNFAMETSASALTFFMKIKKMMIVAGTALPAIGLIVGGLVIMNIMLVAVAERTREIGIRKALGAKRRDILSQFLVEAATLSTMGAVVGILGGAGIAVLVSKVSPLPTHVALWSVIMATLLGTVVGVVAGVYPASRASRLDPIAALRQE